MPESVDNKLPSANRGEKFNLLEDDRTSLPTHRAVHFSFFIDKEYHQNINKLMKEAMSSYAYCRSATKFSLRQTEDVENMDSEKLSKNFINKHANKEISITNNDSQVIFVESVGKGNHFQYTAPKQVENKHMQNPFQIIKLNSSHVIFPEIMDFLRSCVVPEGYPESVCPSYTPYMHWRAMKYFFGGAMSVFTTRSLLHALGVSKGVTSNAVAANWVIKDGAGRIGKMLFARQGKKFDTDVKQLRFLGDLLMEFGAAVELATTAAPNFFLPLACAANVAKNVAAVTSTSTRAPIYKSFARGENIGDVTAKGECVSNIADLVGTGLGIFISKMNPSLLTTFAVLSCGYVWCSYKEVKVVSLPTLNRARFGVVVRSFLENGHVPSVAEGNLREPIFQLPWTGKRQLVLGARVNQAFENPYKFIQLLPFFQKENYLINYNPKRNQVYVVYKEKAGSKDVLKAAFHAEVIRYILHEGVKIDRDQKNTSILSKLGQIRSLTNEDEVITEMLAYVSDAFETFKKEAISQGWIMEESLLNPGHARLCLRTER